MNKKAINIRRFKKSDRPAVNELLQTFHNYTKVNVLDEKTALILAFPPYVNIVPLVATAIENNKEIVVGFGMFVFYPLPDKSGHVGKFEDIVVNSNYHRCGIAEEICKKFISFAEMRGIKQIELTCDKNRVPAHKLYEKLGFVNRDTIVKVLKLEKGES